MLPAELCSGLDNCHGAQSRCEASLTQMINRNGVVTIDGEPKERMNLESPQLAEIRVAHRRRAASSAVWRNKHGF